MYHDHLRSLEGKAVLIVGDKIVDGELILKADKKHIKNASYYLTIGSIIPAGDAARGFDPEKPAKTLVLEPGQIAWVVSEEIFNITEHNVTALVTLRSTMTKRGLLALDVGLVDPDYEGPIGSVIINFSKDRVTLNQGDEFFRVIFFSHEEIPTKYRVERQKNDKLGYIKDRHGDIVSNFPEKFLGVSNIIQDIHDRIFDEFISYIWKKHWKKILLGTFVVSAVFMISLYFSYNYILQNISPEDIVNAIKDNKEIIDLIKGLK